MSFNLYPIYTTDSCPESTDFLPAVIALSAVLAIVVLLEAVTWIGLLYTNESVMLKYVHCVLHCAASVCVFWVCVCLRLYVCMCECVPEGNDTI